MKPDLDELERTIRHGLAGRRLVRVDGESMAQHILALIDWARFLEWELDAAGDAALAAEGRANRAEAWILTHSPYCHVADAGETA